MQARAAPYQHPPLTSATVLCLPCVPSIPSAAYPSQRHLTSHGAQMPPACSSTYQAAGACAQLWTSLQTPRCHLASPGRVAAVAAAEPTLLLPHPNQLLPCLFLSNTWNPAGLISLVIHFSHFSSHPSRSAAQRCWALVSHRASIAQLIFKHWVTHGNKRGNGVQGAERDLTATLLRPTGLCGC